MPRPEPRGSAYARLHVHRRRQNIERCVARKMTRPWAQRAQVSSVSRKFGMAVQNDRHLSEPLALIKDLANERNDIGQKLSKSATGGQNRPVPAHPTTRSPPHLLNISADKCARSKARSDHSSSHREMFKNFGQHIRISVLCDEPCENCE